MKIYQSEELNNLENERINDINSFNEHYDGQYNELVQRHESLQATMNENNMNDYEGRMQQFETNFPEKNPKNTPEILDLYKKLEGIVKKKE